MFGKHNKLQHHCIATATAPFCSVKSKQVVLPEGKNQKTSENLGRCGRQNMLQFWIGGGFLVVQ